jgi:hypothetical protein
MDTLSTLNYSENLLIRKNWTKKRDTSNFWGLSIEYNEVIGSLSRKVHSKLLTESDILDIDSTVKTVYGNQEGAAKGFYENKKGAKAIIYETNFKNVQSILFTKKGGERLMKQLICSASDRKIKT